MFYTNSMINFSLFKHKLRTERKKSCHLYLTSAHLNDSRLKRSKRREAPHPQHRPFRKVFTETCALLVNSSLRTKPRNWATACHNYALHISDYYIIQDTKHSKKRHKRIRRQTCTKIEKHLLCAKLPFHVERKWLWMCAANAWCTGENHISTRKQKKERIIQRWLDTE